MIAVLSIGFLVLSHLHSVFSLGSTSGRRLSSRREEDHDRDTTRLQFIQYHIFIPIQQVNSYDLRYSDRDILASRSQTLVGLVSRRIKNILVLFCFLLFSLASSVFSYSAVKYEKNKKLSLGFPALVFSVGLSFVMLVYLVLMGFLISCLNGNIHYKPCAIV